MSNKARVIEPHSQNLLFECTLAESEKAYEFAKSMEEMGVEVEIHIPSVSESLAHELGQSRQAIEELKDEMQAEIDGHQSCCYGEES